MFAWLLDCYVFFVSFQGSTNKQAICNISVCLQVVPKRPLPLVLFLKVQYYVENGRLFWYAVCLSSSQSDKLASICVLPLLFWRICLSDPPLKLSLLHGTSERKARHLYYSDLRERVLRSECRQQEEVYFQLAGYAMQADLGDLPLTREDMEAVPYFEPKLYFPPWVGAEQESLGLEM